MSYRHLQFGGGAVFGAIILVVLWALGLPSIYQICWGAAAAVAFWWYFEPSADDQYVTSPTGSDSQP